MYGKRHVFKTCLARHLSASEACLYVFMSRHVFMTQRTCLEDMSHVFLLEALEDIANLALQTPDN